MPRTPPLLPCGADALALLDAECLRERGDLVEVGQLVDRRDVERHVVVAAIVEMVGPQVLPSGRTERHGYLALVGVFLVGGALPEGDEVGARKPEVLHGDDALVRVQVPHLRGGPVKAQREPVGQVDRAAFAVGPKRRALPLEHFDTWHVHHDGELVGVAHHAPPHHVVAPAGLLLGIAVLLDHFFKSGNEAGLHLVGGHDDRLGSLRRLGEHRRRGEEQHSRSGSEDSGVSSHGSSIAFRKLH